MAARLDGGDTMDLLRASKGLRFEPSRYGGPSERPQARP
jgi:hypothetical protein